VKHRSHEESYVGIPANFVEIPSAWCCHGLLSRSYIIKALITKLLCPLPWPIIFGPNCVTIVFSWLCIFTHCSRFTLRCIKAHEGIE
jgi:hypothetical protein